MDPAAAALFHIVADLSPAEREAYYAQHQLSPGVRAEVESLLHFDGTPGQSLSAYVAHAAEVVLRETDKVAPGSRYGAYRLVRFIGGGGMGAVYEAEQENPRRRVALKVIKTGLASPELIRRFIQESQALGRLQHPGIAQIYEAGTADTPLGRQPYFAMELVGGEPLLIYADSHRLGARQRLELMMRICDAVHHAHQRGIIHRDLKPGNIIVDASGQPKILDFGVARVIDSDMPSAGQTDAGQLVGTLAYMSPEQVVADPLEVDTRTDVYALGVILFELLAARLPYTTTGKLHEVVHAIRQQDPPPLGAVNPAYRGDIEIIAAKALEKDKARRYGAVAALSDDIRRYLADEPIVARRPTRGYQLQKFAKRNTALVAGAAAVFVALVAGVIASTWQATRATRAERAAAQQMATAKAVNDFLQNDLLAQASSYAQGKPGTKPDPDLKVRTALDRAAAGIAGKFEKQPLIEASIRNTISATYKDLGLFSEAQSQLQQAIELQRRTLGEHHPDTLASMSRLAALYITQGRYPLAEPLAVSVVDAQRRALGEDHPDTLASMSILADMYRMQQRHDKAEPLLLRIIQARRRLKGPEDLDTLENEEILAVVYRLEGKYADAERQAQRVLAIRKRVQGEDHPATLTTMTTLEVLYDTMGRYAEAEALASRLLDAERRVLGPEHYNTLGAMYQLGILYYRQGKYAEAESLEIKAVEAQRRIRGDESIPTLTMKNALGVLYVEEGKYAEAESTLRQVLAVRRRVTGDESLDTVGTMNALAQLHRSRGEFAAAGELFTRVREVRLRVLGAQHPSTLATQHDFGVLYLAQGKDAEAEAAFTEALAGRRKALTDDHPDTLASMLGLVEVCEHRNEYSQAEGLSSEVLRRYTATRPENWRRFKAESLRGDSLAAEGRPGEAEPLLLSGYQGLVDRASTIPAAERPAIQQAADRVAQFYERRGQPQQAAAWRARLKAANRPAPRD